MKSLVIYSPITPLLSVLKLLRIKKSCHVAFNEKIYIFLLVLLKLINVTLHWFQVGLIFVSFNEKKKRIQLKEKHNCPGLLVDWVRITVISSYSSYQYFITRIILSNSFDDLLCGSLFCTCNIANSLFCA